MRKTLFAAVLALAGLAATTTPARAWWDSPTTTSATFPLLTPSGYYTNTYYYGWAYPWFAYYNDNAKVLNGAAVLAGLASVAAKGVELDEAPLPGGEAIAKPTVVKIGPTSGDVVAGKW